MPIAEHTCRARGCTARTSRVMCGYHWALVPPHVKRKVHEAREVSAEEYAKAIEWAIACCAEAEAKEPELYGLTILQPYAWAIVQGHKKIENRGWSPSPKHIGRFFAIHAGVKRVAQDWDEVRARGVSPPLELPLGRIVGVARLAAVVKHSTDPWFAGPIGFELADVQALDPIACKGALGFWAVPRDLVAEIRRRWMFAKAEKAGVPVSPVPAGVP